MGVPYRRHIKLSDIIELDDETEAADGHFGRDVTSGREEPPESNGETAQGDQGKGCKKAGE